MKEGEEKKEKEKEVKKVFNPLAEQRRKEKEQDAAPLREGPKVFYFNPFFFSFFTCFFSLFYPFCPKVKKADCRADGDLKKINTSSIQEGNKSEVREML